MPRFQRAMPVLQVRDVERSMGWYVDTFGAASWEVRRKTNGGAFHE